MTFVAQVILSIVMASKASGPDRKPSRSGSPVNWNVKSAVSTSPLLKVADSKRLGGFESMTAEHKRIGVSQAAPSLWVKGKSLPPPKRLKHLASVLGCDEVWLAHGAQRAEAEAFPVRGAVDHPPPNPNTLWDRIRIGSIRLCRLRDLPCPKRREMMTMHL
jgi:hypothetical protein